MRQNEINRLNYACNPHHIQKLRSQLDPQLQQQIDMSENPSSKYRDILKTVYCQDQIDKTLAEQKAPSIIQEQQNGASSDVYTGQHFKQYRRQPFVNSINYDHLKPPRYIDYELQKFNRYSKIVDNGCNSPIFFKSNDQYLKKKNEQANVAKKTLIEQLKEKEYKKNLEQSFRQKENNLIKQYEKRKLIEDYNNHRIQMIGKISFGQQIKRQIDEKNMMKANNNSFSYNHSIRHNPITNPIQYHIDNPYILNQYQHKIYRHN